MNTIEELELSSNFHNIKSRILNRCEVSSSGCIEYLGTTDSCGYASISVALNGRQRKLGGHRLIYIIAMKIIPTGHVVMHSCDNPCCVNIRHLSVGTVKDNVYDAIEKGRFHSVSRHPRKNPLLYLKFMREAGDIKPRCKRDGLNVWAKNNGVHYQTARAWFREHKKAHREDGLI